MDKKLQFNIWYFVVAVVAVLVLQSLWVRTQQVETIPYSQYLALLESGQVEDIVVTEKAIRGTFKTPQSDGATRFTTTRVDPAMAEDLAQRGVEFKGEVPNTFVTGLLSWLVPVILFLGIWVFLFRRIANRQGLGGVMTIGKSKAKVYMEKDVGVSFDDVAGVDEAKEELQEIVAFLKNPAQYGRLGARIAKGILLVGPPGTGKTLLSRAVAGEAGVVFFSINGSEFVEMFVGVGAARVRDLFEQARQAAPCIIFIDELDALGRARGLYPGGGGHDEKEQTLNQLLAELDGFNPQEGVVLLAATNRPEVLDPALLRAGRFDRQILVDRPDRKGRQQILVVHLRKVTLETGVDPEKIAQLTPGFTGADLANLVNEAAVLATRRGAAAVAMEDFTGGIERIVAGLEKKNRILNELERTTVAHHEMGHALVALALPGSDRVHKISVIPRGIGALGYTLQRPTEDRYLMRESELENKLAVLLGGRAAEKLTFGHLSTGAVDDLAKATEIARSMVMRYGMNEKLGQAAYESEPAPFLGTPSGVMTPGTRTYSEETSREIDIEVRKLIEAAFERATAILAGHRALLEQSAAELLEKESFDEDDIARFKRDFERAPAAAPGKDADAAE